MWQARIHISACLDTAFFPKNSLVDDRIIAAGVHATDLEIGWWQIFVASGKKERGHKRRCWIALVQFCVLKSISALSCSSVLDVVGVRWNLEPGGIHTSKEINGNLIQQWGVLVLLDAQVLVSVFLRHYLFAHKRGNRKV